MSKYNFERLGPDRFEALAQALLEKLFRISGGLVQFGVGKDGGREATWTQHSDHPTYLRPEGADNDIPKEWVFQAKYHDVALRGWKDARAEVESELDTELEKIYELYKVPCHKYVMITNVPFSGVRNVGTRDRVSEVIEKWKTRVPEIEVWDAVDLSRMLDADPDVRKTYLCEILPGDILQSLLKNVEFSDNRRNSAFQAYLRSLLRSERDAKAEEAGDESGLKLEEIFVDLDLGLVLESVDESVFPLSKSFETLFPRSYVASGGFKQETLPSSFAFMAADHPRTLLKGGPGVGKSTITQFLTLFHAARIVEPKLAYELTKHLKLSSRITREAIDAHCRIRYPLRVELRRYAQWMSGRSPSEDTFLAQYLAYKVGRGGSANLSMEDIFALANDSPILLILDGLDEVPNPDTRDTIFRELATFLDRCVAESSDVQLILSSRPQGYRDEFSRFKPIEWHVMDLSREDFDDYAERWLNERIDDPDEKIDARQRIYRGMQAQSVQQMATTLLQATVMLTIARRKQAIPDARHKLYKKYVDVIFEREANKETVRQRSDELLRLHERVGFELIGKMEHSDGSKSLSASEFKTCVTEIIEDYGPSELHGETIGKVVDEILTLAKDRLCLLAGKGEDQRNVDFVIQPFREYFAAAFLAHHEEAEPDKVYNSLVKRRNVWANVLQFYAAFQSKAQQNNWISEADGSDVSDVGFGSMAELTRRRRALLRVLPEFDRPKNEYVNRAFKNLLDKSTRWTWKHFDDAPRLLHAFAPDDAFRIVKQLFGKCSTDDCADLRVELYILCLTSQLARDGSIVPVLEGMLDGEDLADLIMELAFHCDIPIRVRDDLNVRLYEAIQRVARFGEHEPIRFLQSLSRQQLIGTAITIPQLPFRLLTELEESDDRARVCQRILGLLSPAIHSNVPCVMPAYVFDRSAEAHDVMALLAETDSNLLKYLKAIVAAIIDPFDEELYFAALEWEESVKDRIPERFLVEFQLGPSPQLFDSFEEWRRWRGGLSKVFERVCRNWLPWLESSKKSRVCSFLHPRSWEKLASFLDKKDVGKLIEECSADVSYLSPQSVFRIQVHQWRSPLLTKDIVALCLCLVDISSKNGVDAIAAEIGIVDSFSRSVQTPISESHAHILINRALEVDMAPYWSALIIRVLGTEDSVDIGKLHELWLRWKSTGMLWVDNCPIASKRVVERILDSQLDEADCLAAFLTSLQGLSPDDSRRLEGVSEKVVKRLSAYLVSENLDACHYRVRLLLQQHVDLSELDVWLRPEVYELVPASDWGVVRASERLRNIANLRGSVDRASMRSKFGQIVDNRRQYPEEISIAALDAILRLDELEIAPLENADWRKE